MLKSLFPRTSPPVAATKMTLLALIRKGPLTQKEMNNALRGALPGIDCDVFANAVAELLRDHLITITNGTYHAVEGVTETRKATLKAARP